MSTVISSDPDPLIFLNQNDGLLDLFIGFAISFAGLFLWVEMVWMAAIFIPVFLPSFQAARKGFLTSRIREVRVNSQGTVRNDKVFLYTTLLFGVMFLAGIGIFLFFDLMSGQVNKWLQQYILLAIGLIFASVWVFAGAMLKVNRFYLYAVFTFGSLVLAQIAVLPLWISLVIMGGMVTVVGLLVLIQFVRKHPIVE